MKRQRKRHKQYTEQFKRDAVSLMENRGSRTIREVAQSLGVSPSMLDRWREKFGDDSSAPREQRSEDVEQLRRRLRQLEQENELLKKAAAFFAKENL